jgi:glutathione S-transferase
MICHRADNGRNNGEENMLQGDYLWVALVSAVSVLVYYLTLLNAGLARVKFKIPAPSHDGPEDYVRRVRAHQNTVEHLVMFLPSMWTFALLVSPLWAAALGAIWPVGRFFYMLGYSKASSLRRPGLYITMPSIYIFILGSIIGAIYRIVQG